MSYKKNKKVTAVYSNYKNKDGSIRPPEKVEHVVRIEGDDEYYRLKEPSKPEFLKQGATVSFSVNAWTPKGDKALTRYYIKQIEEVIDDPLPNDDMPESEKEWLASPPEQATDFNPVQYEKDNVMDKKGMIIWVQGLIQADIRAGNIKLNDVNESTLADAIDLYKKIAK